MSNKLKVSFLKHNVIITISKLLDSIYSNNLRTKKDSNLWNKSTILVSTNFLNIDSEEKGEIKETENSVINKSTLSLHISAYEKSTEVTADSDDVEKEGLLKNGEALGMVKKWRTSNNFGCGLFFQNPFEFPRQKDDESNRPEMMQFTASQRLLNPNQMDANRTNSNNNNNINNSDSSSGDETSNESNLSTTPIPLKMAPAVEAVATKYLKKGTILESSNTNRRYEVLEILKKSNLCVIAKLQERNVPAWQKNKIFSLKAECGPVMDEEIGLKIELNILAKAAEARHLRPAMVDNIVEIFDRGITDNFRFIIITSLGINLSDLQKNVKGLP
uniref:Uncharacterized protein n=1 Tax=Panagrolaimus sp. ES5 TaxID=591445 RepID=A0AC34F734_9BILA